MVIADRIAILVNTVFENYHMYGTVALAAGAAGFALQIYCDFMGYSTIAVGAARVMGFKLMENFETPYFAKSVSEFWRRWHISLSTWFRDYLYIPLGGNRCSKAHKYLNIMITMTLSGLWHGANWTLSGCGRSHGKAAERILSEASRKDGELQLPACTGDYDLRTGRYCVDIFPRAQYPGCSRVLLETGGEVGPVEPFQRYGLYARA